PLSLSNSLITSENARRGGPGVVNESDRALSPWHSLRLHRVPCRGRPRGSGFLYARRRWPGPLGRVCHGPRRRRLVHGGRSLPSLVRGDCLCRLVRGNHGVGLLSLGPGAVSPVWGRGVLAGGGRLGLPLQWVRAPLRNGPRQRGIGSSRPGRPLSSGILPHTA